MSHFNHKIYWILLPFALVIGISFIVFSEKNGFIYAFITMIIFWVVYYGWVYLKTKGNKST